MNFIEIVFNSAKCHYPKMSFFYHFSFQIRFNFVSAKLFVMKRVYVLVLISFLMVGITHAQNKTPDMKKILIEAKPGPIAVNIANTALIVVDMENDFGSKGGMFDKAGVNISMIQKVVPTTARVLEAARKAGIKIIYLKMGYHEDLSGVGKEGSKNRFSHLNIMHVGDTMIAPDGSESRILIRDSWGTEIVPELRPQPEDIVIYKTRYSGFYQTDLDSILKKLKITYLIVTGCTTSVCVESTVRDAMFRDYSAIVLEDCTAEPIGYDLPKSNHEASILVIQSVLGWVSNSGEFIKAIKAKTSQKPGE